MFIAVNRFRIAPSREDEFIGLTPTRQSLRRRPRLSTFASLWQRDGAA